MQQIDSYSAFFDNGKLHATELDGILQRRGVCDLYVCGLALDICVGYTALDGLSLGYNVFVRSKPNCLHARLTCCISVVQVLRDASRGTKKQDIEEMVNTIVAKGGHVISTSDIPQYLYARKLLTSIVRALQRR